MLSISLVLGVLVYGRLCSPLLCILHAEPWDYTYEHTSQRLRKVIGINEPFVNVRLGSLFSVLSIPFCLSRSLAHRLPQGLCALAGLNWGNATLPGAW